MRFKSGLMVRESGTHWAALISTARVSVTVPVTESATFTSGVPVGAAVAVGGLTIALTVASTFTPSSVLAGVAACGAGVAPKTTAGAVLVGGASTSVIDTTSRVAVAAGG